MAELGAVNSLVSELLANGSAKANNAAKLLALLSTCKQEAALKAAIQGLKQFFVAAGQDGLLLSSGGTSARPAKRQKVAASTAATDASADGPADAEAQYRDWLHRQYGNFTSQLLSLATGAADASSQRQRQPPKAASAAAAAPLPAAAPRSAGVQVVAAAALMECVRSEQGPGVFSGGLYGRLLSGVLLSPAVRPEVFALLFTKHLPLADVRFYTLATIKAVAARHGSGGKQQQAEAEEAEEKDGGEGSEEGASRAAKAAAADAVAAADAAAAAAGSGSGSGGREVSLPDLARNMYDVLCHVADTLPADTREWSTWCGAAEVNLVAAAADKNESARHRRKRKEEEERQQQRRQGQQQGQGQQPQQQRVQWANGLTQRRLYGDAWLALLALPLPPDVLRKALLRLPASVIPHMTGPQLLADFLTHCLNRGGLTGMLALNGLFLLVTRHGLEYPQFFARLYQLLVPEAFAARSRAQFFRLADIFLSSSLVPAYTVAAFVKRFARLALGAPPAGAMIAIALMHNLVRRHPALSVMLHNPAAAGAAGDDSDAAANGGAEAAGKGPAVGEEMEARGSQQTAAAAGSGPGVDPYNEVEADPAKSRAVESSLWEVEALRNHYCPQVSTFCAVLDKDLTDRTKTAEVNLEDLLGTAKGEGQQPGGAGSYSALIHGELVRKLRKAPIAFYSQPPTSLFHGNFDAVDWAGWTISSGEAS
ncbi:hypothetical protein PLESTB_000808400 [Pleodorina starrii]|uniref:CCAAT-binding factor domain-containing protein n=1 Tax=Pleodorina starrii TaxID=330485 RepID=A0A9W6BKP2_9CHLO|nr:hypothetical protein PLESTM_000916300 [Pleodorina starrii]GLC53957.1 hypothetical protein PLESTB_000808400 [Pleodorina starrii]GLC70018.1 hypothetical protein PLESTF_000913800 [Pleodorina starrii]